MKLYTVIAFRCQGDLAPLKYRNVNNLEKCRRFLETKGVLFFNAYDKATREYAGRIYVKTN